MDHNLIGLLMFIAFVVISLLGKLSKKSGNDTGTPPVETPDLDELPETLRRMLMGEPPVRKARPGTAVPQQTDVRPAPAQPRTPYEPQVARPAPPRTPAAAPNPRVQPPVARPLAPRISTAQRPMAPPLIQPQRPAPAAPAMTEEEAPRRRPEQVSVPRPSAPKLSKPRTLQQVALETAAKPSVTMVKQTRAAPERKPAPAPATGVASPFFLKDLHEVRRGIILSEILGPPLAMR